MEKELTPQFSVSDFLAVVNQSLEIAFGIVEIEGEVASFKVNQQKYVFFDLKDAHGSVSCFMSLWSLKIPIEDGMKVIVRANPKVTAWGKFSLTIQSIKPLGEGSIKRSQQLLHQKLEKEGLFSAERKRRLPEMPEYIGVISSTDAAGYKDFIKILHERWGGVRVDVAHVQVQGDSSPDQIVRAINYFNSLQDLPEVIVLIRGGGSADDLSAFSDEAVVRAVATSRVPTLVGVGHESDQTLSDLAADVRASTPTHAAQLVVPNRREVQQSLEVKLGRALGVISLQREQLQRSVDSSVGLALSRIDGATRVLRSRYDSLQGVVHQLNPRTILRRGYALVRSENGSAVDRPKEGDRLAIETERYNIKAEVMHVQAKTN